MDVNLTGSTAIVTGAGRGIGRVIARTFAEAGADVVAAARTESEIAAVADELEAEYGVRALAVPTDVREVDDLDDLVEATVETLGTPDVLVNNAGANINSPAIEQSLADVDQIGETNLRGPYLLAQRFARAYRASDLESGRIVNVSSIGAEVAIHGMVYYGATKAGLNAVTRGLAAELGPNGITVNSVVPGTIEVERIRTLVEEHGEDVYDFDRLPLGRLGRPEEIADVCCFLASEHARYVTGESIRVDGGVGVTAGLYR